MYGSVREGIVQRRALAHPRRKKEAIGDDTVGLNQYAMHSCFSTRQVIITRRKGTASNQYSAC